MINSMKQARLRKLFMLLLTIALIGGGLTTGNGNTAEAAGTTYYVDSVSGNDANSGTSTGSAWRTISKVNSITSFQPGDQILFKRGGTYAGALEPKGSGSAGNPIKLGAYGTGALPLIESSGTFGIRLLNQQYWEIANVEVKGGTQFGIVVTSNQSNQTYTYFRITNVVVRDVTGTNNDPYMGGIVLSLFNIASSQLNDIIVDGATVYNVNQLQGIAVRGSNEIKSVGVIVRNSIVHDTYGNGILVACAEDVLIEHNVSYETGKTMSPGSGWPTPTAIWTWWTTDAIVQFNEAYLAHSWGIDGGGFDIDYYNKNNTYQYNYAHDNEGYGISIFASDQRNAGGDTAITDNAVVRYNIFSNNGRKAGNNGAGQGSIYLAQWDNGFFGSLKIYNNTIFHNPNTSGAFGPALVEKDPRYATGNYTRIFKNNLIYSNVAGMIGSPSNGIQLDNNLYYSTTGNYNFYYNGINHSSFANYKSASGQDANSLVANPQLNNPTYSGVGFPVTAFTLQAGSPAINAGTDVGSMGSQDFFGNALPVGGAYDIGAHEYSGGSSPVEVKLEAEGLSYTNSGDWTANYADSLTSGGFFSGYAANAVGDHITYTVPVSIAGTYRIYVGNKAITNRGQYQLLVNGTSQGNVVEQYAASALYPETEHGTVTLGAGSHAFRFEVTGKHPSSSGYQLGIDYIRLVPVIDVVLEAESLSYTNSGDWTANYADSLTSGGFFSGYAANAVGDYIEYTINVPAAGTYTLAVGNKNIFNRGQYQVSVNGTNVGAVYDQYAASAVYAEVPLGSVTFSSAGSHTVRFTITGKASASSDYQLGIDYIRLSS